MDFRSSWIKVQFVITIRLFKLYYSFCFSTLLINRELYWKMLYFSKILKWELNTNATELWSNSMKNHKHGIFIALVCCVYRSFSLRWLTKVANVLENHSYKKYHSYIFQISCQYNLLPHIRQPDWKCYIVITDVTVNLLVIIDKTFIKMSLKLVITNLQR